LLPNIRPVVVLVSFVGGGAYLGVFMALTKLFPPDQFVAAHPANFIRYASGIEKGLFALSAIVFAPIAEEILFRGVLYQGISHSWGKPVSAILVSAAFVALHPDTISSGYWVTHMALYVFPFFVVFLREATGTLYGPIAAHSGFNATEILF
jgi:membrane protease YdiL (CAAX protease family)